MNQSRRERGRVGTFPRAGRVIRLRGGEYDHAAPSGEIVCNVMHGRCFHQGIGGTLREAMMAAYEAYLEAHGGVDEAPTLLVTG